MELQLLHLLHSTPSRLRAPVLFPTHFTTSSSKPHFRYQTTTRQNPTSLFFSPNQQQLLQHQEFNLEEDPHSLVEEEEDDESSFLSLSEKPDRTMALLDDYETEELDFDASSADHKSGLLLVMILKIFNWVFCLGCVC